VNRSPLRRHFSRLSPLRFPYDAVWSIDVIDRNPRAANFINHILKGT